MSLWGNKDTVYSTGNVTTITSAGVITISGSTLTGNVEGTDDHHGCLWWRRH